ncbi:MAG: mechanosensitive ion channel family protein [Alphaproteobacteria bacterium]|nr:mechanosensitive ion channel family protein [Alphaproteobacteria bacterium]
MQGIEPVQAEKFMDDKWINMLRDWNSTELGHILLILFVAFIVYETVRVLVPRVTKLLKPNSRFYTLPWVPLLRLIIILWAATLIVPLVITPTRENILALLGATALAVGFAVKDYISCFFAGLFFLMERPYRVGDWVQIGDTYGEVTEIGLRAVKLVTADDNAITIPHSTLWTQPLSNATSGAPDLLCVIHFFVSPDHNNALARKTLEGVAASSPYINPERPIVVVMNNEPFGLRYKLKAYPKDAREQFLFIADVTERGNFALHKIGLTLAASPAAVAVPL